MKLPVLAKKLKINDAVDFPLHLPVGLQDNRNVLDNFQPYLLPDGTEVVCRGVVNYHDVKWTNGKPRLVITLTDFEHTVGFALFGDQRNLQSILDESESLQLCVRGTVSYFKGKMYLNQATILPNDVVGTLKAVYPGIRGIARPESVYDLIQGNLLENLQPCADKLLTELLSNPANTGVLTKLLPGGAHELAMRLHQLHRPSTVNEFDIAKRLLERLAVIQAANIAMAGNITGRCAPIIGPDIEELKRYLPFEPTNEQINCAVEATSKMAKGIRSHALLVGDVGTGKTAVMAMIARYVLLSQGHRKVVVMLPNEALACQVHNELSSYIPEVTSSLVTGDAEGALDNQLLVGTTALLFRQLDRNTVDLLIVDESQKFSRAQREKIETTHLLEASATPIPRTAALAQFGAVDVLTLRKAHTQKAITTRVCLKEHADTLMASVYDTLDRGAKVLVVCPKREDNGQKGADIFSAEQIAFALDQQFPGQVRMMHSGLSSEENEFVLNEFKAEIPILVSTSKIEVGVTVPGLRHVIVYGADRFGLTTLHQIRGRLARIAPEDGSVNWGKFDLFLPNGAKEKTLQRLAILVESQDGFSISEKDMALRGVGDLGSDSDKQHGTTSVGIQNVTLDIDKIAKAIEYIAKMGC
jgi:ATP-dependent DNA helicase RecG